MKEREEQVEDESSMNFNSLNSIPWRTDVAFHIFMRILVNYPVMRNGPRSSGESHSAASAVTWPSLIDIR